MFGLPQRRVCSVIRQVPAIRRQTGVRVEAYRRIVMNLKPGVGLVVGLSLVVASCSGSSTDGTGSDSVTTASPIATPATTTLVIQSEDVVIQQLESGRTQEATLYGGDAVEGSPVVVLLHGAGGRRQTYAGLSEAIADLGAIVLNADWLADPARPLETTANAICAVAYANENATSWGGDPNRIIVVGHSGGGHVGMLAALAPELLSDCENASESVVWAYVGLAGDPGTAREGGNGYSFWKDNPDWLATLDAFNHIGENSDLIVRFVHGDADTTVPLERISDFNDAMVDAGYDSQLLVVDGADHGAPASPTSEAGIVALEVIAELFAAARD